MLPSWLHWLAIVSLLLAAICAIAIAVDETRDPQQMWIMNLVWPATALFGSVVALYAYRRVGKLGTRRVHGQAKARGEEPPSKQQPFAVKVAKGAMHCGSGCTLGDLCAEWLVFAAPVVATWFGYRSLFGDRIFATWIVDYLFAFGFGVAFQYFTIKPMRGLSPGQGILQALKADAASLTAWQVGMYGFMALAHFLIFEQWLGVKLRTDMPEFWLMMQIAMWFGFATSYPVNALLIRNGVKEAM